MPARRPPRRPSRAPGRQRRLKVSQTGQASPARTAKGPAAFRTIGEVADDLDLPPHVLRFWESKFPQLRPLKRGGGRRYYRPEDIILLRHIRQCLYQDGYTIRGVQKLLGAAAADPTALPDTAPPPTLFPLEAPALSAAAPPAKPRSRPGRRPMSPQTKAALEEIRRELIEIRAQLAQLMREPKP